MLATSREALGVEGEQLWPVHPLALDAGTGGDPAPAVRLLHERAEAARPGALTPDDPRLQELARRLDGVPLALELAAGRLGSMSVDELLEQLDADVLTLGSTRRGAEERHRSLAAMVEWSYQLLGDEEQRVLAALAVFAGGFTRTAAAQVVGPNAPAALDHLVEASLVTIDGQPGTTRLRMLEMIREFAAARLDEADDADALRLRHAEWAAEAVHALQLDLRGPDEAAAAERFEQELANVGAALRWACDAGRYDLVTDLVNGFNDHVFSRAGREVHAWIAMACEAMAGRPDAGDVLTVAAVAAIRRGDLPAAERYLSATDGLEVSDEPWFGTEGARGTLAMFSGRMEEAHQHFERMVATAPHPTARTLGIVEQSFTLAYAGRFAEAAERSGQALAMAEELGTPTLLAWSCFGRGEALVGIDPTRALEAYEQAGRHGREARNPFIINLVTVGRASALARHGEPTEALEEFATAIDRWRAMGAWSYLSTTLRNLGELLVRIDRFEAALELRAAMAALASTSGVGGVEVERDRYLSGLIRERLGDERYQEVVARAGHRSRDEITELAVATVAAELRTRRNVAELRAIAFTDLESSTRFLADSGDQDGRAVMRRYDLRTDEVLARHRGQRIKGTGDGVLATFPTATDALRFAIDLVGGVERDVRSGDLPLRLRVGVHVGEAITDLGDVHGTAVNLAARVVDRAEAGEVLITEVVRQVVLGSDLQVEDAGSHDLKGIPEPVRLHRLAVEIS